MRNKIQEIHKDVFLLQPVDQVTKFLVSVMKRAAMLAEHALFHLSQDQTDQNASDQDQHAHALRNTQLMDTAAFHAQLDKFQTKTDNNATQLQSAMVLEKFSVPDKIATDAKTAHKILFQMIKEEDVSDQFQLAHVLKNTQLMDTSAKNAQQDLLLIQTTTRDASQESAVEEMKSSHLKTTAGDVMSAQVVTNQTQPELSVLELSQNVAALRSMIAVVMSACHAQHTKLPPTVTKDVSQDNAQESTKSLVQLTNAMLAKHAKRVPHQTT
jgi:hypothetical protein